MGPLKLTDLELALWVGLLAMQLATFGPARAEDAPPQPDAEVNIPGCSPAEFQSTSPTTTRGRCYLMRGQRLLASQRPAEALDDFAQAAQTGGPIAAAAHRGRQFIFDKRREWSAAAEETRKLIEIDPKSPVQYQLLGHFLSKSEHPDQAISAYNDGIAHQSDNKSRASLLQDRAQAYNGIGDYSRAEADHTESITIFPTARSLILRGMLRFHADRLADAIADFTRANELDPSDNYAVLWLHMAEKRSGKTGQENLRRLAARLSPEWPRELVQMFLGEQKPDDIEVERGLKPDDWHISARVCELAFYTAELHLAKGDKEGAIRLFRTALEANVPEFVEHGAAIRELAKLQP